MTTPATVLVLEEQPNILLHSVGIVEDAGFTVLAAGGVGTATSLLEGHGEIEMAFADMDAPGCDALLADMRVRWPAVRLVLTATGITGRNPRIPRGAAFFQKPFAAADIEAALTAYAA